MNKLISCALLGIGLTQGLIACGDDDSSGNDGTAAVGGGGTSSGSSSGGTMTKGGNAGSGNRAGTASGGTAGKGMAGEDAGGESPGGMGGMGGAAGDAAGGDGQAGADVGGQGGTGGEPMEPEPVTVYAVSTYCAAVSAEALGCENSQSWSDCYNSFAPFAVDGDGTLFCHSDPDPSTIENPDIEKDFPNRTAVINMLTALVAACPKTTVDDWRCNVEGRPQALNAKCREAHEAFTAAATTCDAYRF